MAKSLAAYEQEKKQGRPEVSPRIVGLAGEIEAIADNSELRRHSHMDEGQFFILIERDEHPNLIAMLEDISDHEKNQIASILTDRYKKKGWAEIHLTKDEKGWRKKTLVTMIVFLFKNRIEVGHMRAHGVEY